MHAVKIDAVWEVFHKYMEKAVAEIAEKELTDFYWAENAVVRLADQATGLVAAMQQNWGITMARLIDAAKALPPAARTTFVDGLAAEAKAELLELKAAFHAGELPSWAHLGRIYREIIVPKFGEICAEDTFARWMRKHDSKAISGGNLTNTGSRSSGGSRQSPGSNLRATSRTTRKARQG